MTELLYIFGAFILSSLCGFLFIPIIIRFCKKKGLYDIPDNRKIHKRAIPRLGGISFLPSMLLASLLVAVIFNQYSPGKQIQLSTWSVGFFFSLLIIYGVGFIDDILGLGAKSKFSAQILAAIILPFTGLYINNLYGILGIHEIPFAVGAFLTVFVIVFASNAINLIDGIDGLSSGLSFIALTGFLICFIPEKMLAYCILIAGLMGVLIPFFYFNVFGKAEKNHKIFMGDSGSLTLGFILGFLFVKYTMYNPNVWEFHDDAMMLAYSFVIVPMYDVVRVSFVRLKHHKPVFQADRNHIHHKLMRAGLNQHQALLYILATAILFICINIGIWQFTDNLNVIVASDIIVWLCFHGIVNSLIRKKGEPTYLENPQ